MLPLHSPHRRSPAAMKITRADIEAVRQQRKKRLVFAAGQRELERRRDKDAWEAEIVRRSEAEREWIASMKTGLPHEPCFKCGAARWCEHRKPDSF